MMARDLEGRSQPLLWPRRRAGGIADHARTALVALSALGVGMVIGRMSAPSPQITELLSLPYGRGAEGILELVAQPPSRAAVRQMKAGFGENGNIPENLYIPVSEYIPVSKGRDPVSEAAAAAEAAAAEASEAALEVDTSRFPAETDKYLFQRIDRNPPLDWYALENPYLKGGSFPFMDHYTTVSKEGNVTDIFSLPPLPYPYEALEPFIDRYYGKLYFKLKPNAILLYSFM